jgi:hypothetical protein
MALEATHIRFAIDLKDRFNVQNMERYISGTIYPDSRYVTGMDRMATHPEDYTDWDLKRADDFKKGWLVHLFADHIQWEITKELLPKVFEGSEGQGGERWIKHTAIKILQDLDDVRKFDIKSYLPYLRHVENPNGENVKMVERYNLLFLAMYADPATVNIDSCYEMWKAFGIGDELAEKIKFRAGVYLKDKAITETIHRIYPAMLLKAAQWQFN